MGDELKLKLSVWKGLDRVDSAGVTEVAPDENALALELSSVESFFKLNLVFTNSLLYQSDAHRPSTSRRVSMYADL